MTGAQNVTETVRHNFGILLNGVKKSEKRI